MKRTRALLIGLFVAALLAVPAIAFAGNSNPLCYGVEHGGWEWYLLLCNLTESPPGSEG